MAMLRYKKNLTLLTLKTTALSAITGNFQGTSKGKKTIRRHSFEHNTHHFVISTVDFPGKTWDSAIFTEGN